jgi:signal transduction histidine kinase
LRLERKDTGESQCNNESAVTRTLGRIAIAGAACALLLWIGGALVERLLLGGAPAAGRARVERDVRDLFSVRSQHLKDSARQAAPIGLVTRAVADDAPAARELFAAARAALPNDGDEAAVTIYNADHKPIAWSGRPSELRFDSLAGGESWFVSQGALGLRLVYVAPLQDGASRLGTVATEVGLPDADPKPSARPLGSPGAFWLPTRLADVRLELFPGARTQPSDDTFDVRTPAGQWLVTASVSDSDVRAARDRWSDATHSLVLIALAITVLLLAAPLLDWRNRSRQPREHLAASALVIVLIMAARILLRLASPADWSDAEIFSGTAYASPLLWSSFASPFDFLANMLTLSGVVALLCFVAETWRLRRWSRRRAVHTHTAFFLLAQLVAGTALAAVLVAHQAMVRDTIAHASVDLLHFSLHPWNNARIALQVGLVLAHASMAALAVLVLRIATIPWRLPRRSWPLRLVLVGAWIAPLPLVQFAVQGFDPRQVAMVGTAAVLIASALALTRLESRYRRGSQAFRLMLLTLALIVPAFAFYPLVFQGAWDAKSQLVETRYASQPLNQRDTVKAQLRTTLDQIDRFPNLRQLIAAPTPEGETDTSTNRAFQVWQTTALRELPMTSSVELYRANGTLVSRFAFNLPEDLTGTPRSEERRCDWDLFEETAPFFAEDRRVLHAGRALCVNDDPTRVVGSIIVHAMLDYGNLPFIQSETPYVQLQRPQSGQSEGVSGRDIEFAVYGWSGTPLYSSNEAAWPLADEAFERAQLSRDPFWTRLRRGSEDFDTYLVNDRFGIYALGFPVVSPLGHLVNLAELIVLASLTYLLLLAGGALFGWLGRRRITAPKLLREVRASFYRKLFLAFVAAVIFPVALLAFVTRQYVADEMRANVAQEAIRTAAAARRVVEDLVGPRGFEQKIAVDDNLLVWISRLINQDVNIFADSRLVATSERGLFASGLLPTRIPADVYEGLNFRREAAVVTRETVGPIDFLVAGTPITQASFAAGTLTVPLTSRELQIEEQIDTFDRRVLLAALLFILAGSWLGYRMAERIADPVNRLTRATRRIARGDLEARVAATSSDELRRLVEDFNSMADDLQRQRRELERTHRLEAWAEMARQVAHEIKNPLTPIQLNAEHLRRVHADRGEPLSPVLQECVATILQQVTLLRQIASEFSSFASSPTAKPSLVDLAAMLREIISPYERALAERIRFEIDIPPTLPAVTVDRNLVARSLTNIVENALHAMPGTGSLALAAHVEAGSVHVRIADTGVGMDAEALERAFEPYFSTKATGTGLGLPIAKRNVELSGGTISVASEHRKGTTVEITLPLA